jgi:aspartate racemase
VRKLGLIGGMSWVSTRTYYEHLNRIVQRRLGGQASAPLLIESLDFAGLARLSDDAEWERAAQVLCESARRLETAGAGALIIAANSMHRVHDEVAAAVSIPIIHIADTVGRRMAERGVRTAALLGTSAVMTESFYRQRLVAHGIALLPPDMDGIPAIEALIYDDLMREKASRTAERACKTWITNQAKDGAQAIVLACTELEMVVDVDANVLPIYDGTRIHAEAAADWIFAGE